MAIIAQIDCEFYSGYGQVCVVISEIKFDIVAPDAKAPELGIFLAKVERNSISALIVIKICGEKRLIAEIAAANAARGIPRECIENCTEILITKIGRAHV